MNRMISPCLRNMTARPGMFLPGKIGLIFISSFLSFSTSASNLKKDDSVYVGNYQSYFDDETEEVSSVKQSPLKTESESTAAKVIASSPLVTILPANKIPNVSSTAAPTVKKDKNEGLLSGQVDDVSVLRLRQDDPPVHWNSIGRNMDAGGLHGNIGSQIEIDDVRWNNNNKNGGKFKLATIQAFLRHDELPNWYFGFWNAREDDYKGQFSNQDYSGSNTINEFFVGHIFETWRGNIGAEIMGGSETSTKRWKSRIKLWQDLRLTNKWGVAGYVYGEYQPQGNQPGNGDLEQYIFETEPSLQYRVNPDLGIYLRPYYYYNRQERAQWGDIIEREWKVTAGFWKNWYPLLTSLYFGVGQDKTTNASNTAELFYDGRYKFIGGTISYPVFGEVRLYSEFKATFTKENGEWTPGGHSWNPFTVVGVVYNF